MKELFVGKVFHKRLSPKINAFTYSIFSVKFDLKDKPNLGSRFFSVNRFNLFSFYDRDHGHKNDSSPLEEWVQETLGAAGLKFTPNQIVLQTLPRVLGYVFNPVSFWYCYRDNIVEAIICEVNNTFGETHSYVLRREDSEAEKVFHVSPFYPTVGKYQFDFKDQNRIRIDYFQESELQLQTSLVGKTYPLTDKNLLWIFFSQPLMTFRVIVLIHWQGLKLFLKKIKYFYKPKQRLPRVTLDELPVKK